MPYVATDPRAQLSTAGAQPAGVPRPATYRELSATPPDELLAHGTATWWTRSQALLIGYSSARAGDELTAGDIAGEYARAGIAERDTFCITKACAVREPCHCLAKADHCTPLWPCVCSRPILLLGPTVAIWGSCSTMSASGR